MDIVLIILIVVVVIAAFLIFKLINNIVRAALTFLLLAIILIGGFAVVAVIDTISFSKELRDGRNILLFANEDISSGLYIDGLNITQAQVMPQQDIDEFNTHYDEMEFQDILQNRTYLIILNRTADPDTPEQLSARYLLSQYRAEDIILYPKTITMRIIDIIK